MLRMIHFHPDEGSGETSDETETSEETTEETTKQGGSGSSHETGPDLVPRSELAKANADAAKRRKELREAEKKIEELEGERKTQQERDADRAKKAEEERDAAVQNTRNLRVRVLAEDVGIVREARSDAASLLDWSQIDDPEDDDQVKAALEELVESRPYLMGNIPAGADGGAGGTRRNTTVDMNAEIRRVAGKQ
jgi:TolA-binding protein